MGRQAYMYVGLILGDPIQSQLVSVVGCEVLPEGLGRGSVFILRARSEEHTQM